MALEKPSADRRFSFAELSAQLQIPLERVELLVMHAFALGVARGTLDGVADVVCVCVCVYVCACVVCMYV